MSRFPSLSAPQILERVSSPSTLPPSTTGGMSLGLGWTVPLPFTGETNTGLARPSLKSSTGGTNLGMPFLYPPPFLFASGDGSWRLASSRTRQIRSPLTSS